MEYKISCEDSTDPVNVGEATATDNCAVAAISFEDAITAGDCINNFDILRTWTAMDSASNFGTCTQLIEVRDLTPPTITCPADTTVSCEDSSPAAAGMATATDNCDGEIAITFEDVIVSGDCDWECTIERTWTATDECGNASTCVQMVVRSALPLIEEAIGVDIDGDGIADPITLGITQHTLTIDLGGAACILEWMPGVDAPAWPLTRENVIIDGTDCTPGENPVAADGQIMSPLMATVLILDIKLRLEPGYGDNSLEGTGCSYHLILNQYMPNNPTVRDLYELSQIALGSLIGPPHLEHLLDALTCVNGTFDLCTPPTIDPFATTYGELATPDLTSELTEAESFVAFPNPANDLVTLTFRNTTKEIDAITLFDQTGRLIWQDKANGLTQETFDISLAAIPPGIYFIQVIQDGERTSKKLVKLK